MARAESIFELPTFRDAARNRRCLVPASGFYEWQPLSPKEKQPFYFKRDNGPFFIAGLWESWGSTQITTFALLTREADSSVLPIHSRMPVILDPNDVDIWMNPKADAASLREILKPKESGLVTYPVSSRVNSTRNDGPELLAPVPPATLF